VLKSILFWPLSFARGGSLHNLLIYRFIILNALLACAAFAAVWAGLATPIYATDASHITKAITVVFAIGWCWTAYEIWRISRGLNEAKMHGASASRPGARDKAMAKLEWLPDLAEMMTKLGYLGTLIGVLVALPEVVSAGDMKAMIIQFMFGVRMAIGTTILGIIASMWHEANIRMLYTSVSTYWADRIAEQERLDANR
jgi:hypothetical protein